MASRIYRQLFRNTSFVSQRIHVYRINRLSTDTLLSKNNLRRIKWNKIRSSFLQHLGPKVKLKHVLGTNAIFCAVALCYSGYKNGKTNFQYRFNCTNWDVCMINEVKMMTWGVLLHHLLYCNNRIIR